MNEFDSSNCNLTDPYNGVWCDNSTKVLSLKKNGFVGQVPSSFHNLSLLSVLDLSQNTLTGSFPPVRSLVKLSVLDLSYNHFSGTLNPNSSLFELHHLRHLDLCVNNFSSSMPSEFGNLNRLEVLSLCSSDFFGQVPLTISNLTSLMELYLDHNQLTGSFPLVQNLTKLSFVDFSYNHFSGTIPSLVMPFLSILDLRRNDLTGSLKFPNSSRLESMYLGNNHFEGTIIEPISKLISLKVLELSFFNTSYPVDLSLFSPLKSLLLLDLSGNSISPDSLGSKSDNPSNLENLWLTGCSISEFPNIVKNLERLEFIGLSDNRIKGKVPEWLWNLPRLNTVLVSINLLDGFEGPVDVLVNSSVKNLFMDQNSFEGAIPVLPLSINVFSASHNRFTGSIPLSICNYRSLTDLRIGYNNLTGPIPQCLSNLTLVNLRKNNLEGSIPDAFYLSPLGFAELRIFEISDNEFTGSLPPTYFVNWKASSLTMNEDGGLYMVYIKSTSGRLSYFNVETIDLKYKGLSMEQENVLNSYATIDFSGNKIEGQIPKSIGLLKALIALNFSNNAFTGHIPMSFSSLSNLESLDLSSNQLSGTIPNGLASLSFLGYINVSHNQLKGEIPQGTQITGQPKSSFEENAGLCGLPLQETCFGINAPPTQQPKEEKEGEEEQVLNWKGVAIGYASYKPEWLVKIIDYSSYVACGPHQTRALTDLIAATATSMPIMESSATTRPVWSLCYNSEPASVEISSPTVAYFALWNPSFFSPHYAILDLVNLRKNNLEGSIPDASYLSSSLRTLDVGHNRLTGKLPRSLLNCSSLEFLVVDHNQIKDKFPFWLKALPNLQVLILSSNKFYGSISPPGQGPLGFPELRIFEISDDKFTGSLPQRYFVNWKASSLTMNEDGGLYMVHSGMNQLVLSIDFTQLIKQRLHRPYSPVFLQSGKARVTRHIKNNLSGTIPNGLGSLSFLAYINVSHNQLKGEMPQGTQITGQAKSFFEGNAELCGLPLQETCFGTIAPPTQQPKEDQEEEQVLNWKGVVTGYGLGVLLGLAIAQVIASYKPELLLKIIGPSKRTSR
ncbi:hypothetical protein HID58_062263 [Brassica napus]|uniref:Disease resistance R13L4/SHOC-2-like LRR domain-containing protein n=1 Tax=Brassica napus TaxID=3708 RepID=A0ABQ8A0X6_BRANA|nr:hypothetical protein HID58_062263 [Brassica napus]